MALVERVINLVRGFLGLFIGGLEARNPAAVYDAAIQAREKQYQNLMQAVSGVVHLKNKTQKELEDHLTERAALEARIPQFIQAGDEETALQAVERKEVVEAGITRLRADLDRIVADAERHKQDLETFKTEIEKLKAERNQTLARHESAKARLKVQEQLSGMSVDADLKALDGIRESVAKTEAQAELARDMNQNSLSGKMASLDDKMRSANAKSKLEEYKRQMGMAAPASESERQLGQASENLEQS
ncbi:MAG: PspA/IM30 family protein [Candidatus Sericytochromatia bacterium]|nr:PspA/IM30 family protein [Candidatus Tanganyikabacteria bacterium]